MFWYVYSQSKQRFIHNVSDASPCQSLVFLLSDVIDFHATLLPMALVRFESLVHTPATSVATPGVKCSVYILKWRDENS